MENVKPTDAQLLCVSCGAATPKTIHFCSTCQHILPLPDRVSYYEFFEMSPRLDIDVKELEKTFFRLSRQFHPDYYQARPDKEQKAALERSATLNRGFETLKDPVRRIEYFLRLTGFESCAPKNQVPKDLMMDILELQELLEDFQSNQEEQSALRTQIINGIEEMKQRLAQSKGLLNDLCVQHDRSGQADRAPLLQRMRDTIDKTNYLQRIIQSMESTVN